MAMCMKYFDVWNKHQYWMDIIYMKKKLFLVSFSFWSLKIWHFLYLFLSHFGFEFSMKGVLLWCLMGVCVDKTIVQIFFVLVLIFMILFCTWSMKKCKIANSSHKVPNFLEQLIWWKMQHLYAYFHKQTL